MAQHRMRPATHHYHVYVIELSDEVWNAARFRRANPDYQLGKPFVYVGMTGLDPDVRFDKHKAGIQSNVVSPAMLVTRLLGVFMPSMRKSACRISPVLRFKCFFRRTHNQMHGTQHVGQQVVGLDLQVIGF